MGRNDKIITALYYNKSKVLRELAPNHVQSKKYNLGEMSEKIRETSQIQAYDFIPVIFCKI